MAWPATDKKWRAADTAMAADISCLSRDVNCFRMSSHRRLLYLTAFSRYVFATLPTFNDCFTATDKKSKGREKRSCVPFRIVYTVVSSSTRTCSQSTIQKSKLAVVVNR